MKLERLEDAPDESDITCDLVIVGGGACGLTLARAMAGAGLDIVVLESGEQEETEAHEALNRVELSEASHDPDVQAFRDRYHSVLTRFWTAQVQGYGVRCRGLGGSTRAWAGKSAPFEDIDFEARPWVPYSGWPIDRAELAAYLRRAETALGLGPPVYDAGFWAMAARPAPEPPLTGGHWSSVFWQFSRSSLTATGIRRLGAEFLHAAPAGVRVILGATVTEIDAGVEDGAFRAVRARSLSGRRLRVRARFCVLAASAVENARLLLASDRTDPRGLGNLHDQVGRHLIDHVGAVLGRYDARAAGPMAARFGFFGYRHEGRAQIAMHGLALSDAAQRQEKLLNGAVYIAEERAPDDPFSALGRLLRRRSSAPWQDLSFVAQSPGRLVRGLGVKALESGALPRSVTQAVADTAVRFFPNSVASDVRYGKVPHKFTGARLEGICEQAPNPENRVTLSDARDGLGQRVPRVAWTVGSAERETLARMGDLFAQAMTAADLPGPDLANRDGTGSQDRALVTDMGHSMGTTRMAADPRRGVVDPSCQVFGVPGLFIAGGSVMPTAGHANPTLMMLALTERLADHLRRLLGQTPTAPRGKGFADAPAADGPNAP